VKYDFISLELDLKGSSICFEFLNDCEVYMYGWEKFTLKKENVLEVWYNRSCDLLRVKGSLPYFWKGQNMFYTNEEMLEALQYASEMLNIDLFDAIVKKVEFGTIVQTDHSPLDVFKHHHNYKNKPLVRFDHGLGHEALYFKYKMYDAGRNIKSKTTKSKRLSMVDIGYDPQSNYIKLENHIKNLPRHFNQPPIVCSDLFLPSTIEIFRADLLRTYCAISKSTGTQLPQDKKNINASTIPMIVLNDLSQKHGFDVNSELMAVINRVPSQTMNTFDKKARKRQIRSNLKKVKAEEVCVYDLMGDLTGHPNNAYNQEPI
jgi:hypothetical protein